MLIKCLIIFSFFLPTWVRSDEHIYVVNSKRPLHIVSDRFLSISIDPAILLTKINLSDVSLQMARHLSPAYVRIAGPSTEFVRYLDTDEKSKDSEDPNSVTVTPSVWFAINEWFNMANLTPVFGINDAEATMGVWNPKSILPLLEISDKFNLTCMWQLGYDSSNKTDTQYTEDLRILRHILDAFPDKKNSWKVVGSNIRKCSHKNGCRRLLDSLKGITDYVVWEQSARDQNMLNDELAHIMFGERTNPKIWTSVSRNRNPATFETALTWAKEVGEAARNGFDVILRTPRIYEFFVDTPVFWFSLLYKTLVGNVVLDMRSAGSGTGIDAFAYCAKHQNDFNQRGAMVIMSVNQEEHESTIQLRLSALAKNMEVQSYVLTSKSDLRSIYLNGEKLKSSFLQEPLVFTPKLRRAKPSHGVSFSLPAKSIGFFVLPGARVTACMDDQEEMDLLMEEIESDQELPLSAELMVEMNSRNLQETPLTLKDMERELQEELEVDQKFYLKKEETHKKLDDILEDLNNSDKNEDPQFHMKIDKETRRKILERARLIEAQRKLTESEQRLVDLSRMVLAKSIDMPKHVETTTKESVELFEDSLEHEKVDKIKIKEHPKFSSPTINNLHHSALKNSNAKKLSRGKPESLHDQFRGILNSATLNSLKHPLHERNNHDIDEFELPKLNSIHHDEFHDHHDPKKLALVAKNAHDHLKEVLANSRAKQFKKVIPNEKTPETLKEIELELTSAEVKKVLADRVKSRAAKTNIRFTNEELSEIMRKATEKLKHDHVLKVRTGLGSSRPQRDINMKLLNEASKIKPSRKEPDDTEESSEIITKKKLNLPSKNIIVNPLYRKSGKQKKSKTTDSSDMASSELDDDLDFYFDEDGTQPKKLHSNEKKKKDNLKNCFEKKRTNMRKSDNDFEEEDDLNKKFMRLDEYFRNAKEAQEKFDDIDFSEEDDYGNMEGDGNTRSKRDTPKNKRSRGCTCSNLAEDIVKTFRKLLDNDNKEEHEALKHMLEKYDNIVKNDKELSGTIKKRRSVDGLQRKYRPICDSVIRWRPEDILSIKSTNNFRSKPSSMINDLPLYQHLLHRNDVRRSIRDDKKENLISQDSDGNIDSTLNRIDKDDASEDEHNERDFQLTFPNKNKLELTKNENMTKIMFEYHAKPDELSIDNTTTMSSTNINKIKKESEIEKNGKMRLFHKEVSNIQLIPKNGTETIFHHAFGHLHSFIHKIGSSIKKYFDNIFN